MEPTSQGLHVKTRDRIKVLDALAELMASEGRERVEDDGVAPSDHTSRVLVAPPRGPWTSVYWEEPTGAAERSARLCGAVGAPGLLVARFDALAFAYEAYDPAGAVADAYHSCPDYVRAVDEDDAPAAEVDRTRGDAARLVAALGPAGGPARAQELQAVLDEARIERLHDHDAYTAQPDAEAALERLAEALSLPDLQADFDEVRHFTAEEHDLDVCLLAFRPTPEPGRVERLMARVRRRREGEPADAQDGGAEAPPEEGASPGPS